MFTGPQESGRLVSLGRLKGLLVMVEHPPSHRLQLSCIDAFQHPGTHREKHTPFWDLPHTNVSVKLSPEFGDSKARNAAASPLGQVFSLTWAFSKVTIVEAVG